MRHARNTLTLCAALGIMVLSGCDSDEPTSAAPTSTSPSPREEGPISLAYHEGPIEPGQYAVPVWGDDWESWPRAVVDVPAGYGSGGGWVVQAEEPGRGWLTFQYADRVVRDPCAATTTAASVGPTASDLTTALTRQPGRYTSEPEPVTIGDYDGFYLKLRVPRGVDLTKCDRHEHILWTFGAEGRLGLEKSDRGGTIHLWILDVDGRRIIMTALTYADPRPSQTAEILAMARGTRFIAPSDL